MPNLNYAEQWSPELLAILIQGTLTSPFITNNVRWLDAKTFHFTQMSVSGYKNHKGDIKVFGVTRHIYKGTKCRNPDGTVNYVRLDVM